MRQRVTRQIRNPALMALSTQHMIHSEKATRKPIMSFQVAARERDRIIVVDVVGRLTLTDSRTQLRDLVHVFTSNGHKKFLINLEGVDFVDSNGLGELTRCFCSVRQAGGDMKLVHVNPRVQSLLEMTRINNLFDIYTEEQVALEAFR